MKGILNLILCVVVSSFSIAQNNVFLERSYWNSKPSLEQVKQDIAAGNDATQLNQNAFDAVVYAINSGADNDVIFHLLSLEGNDVNKLTHDGRTYIFWAGYKGNLQVLEYLMSNGANTDVIDSHGYTYLNFTANAGQQDTALYDFIFENGGSPKQVNKQGANALLLIAPSLKDEKLLSYFISKGFDLNATDYDGNNIFNYASKKVNPDFLNLLVEKGIDYKSKNENGGNAFLFAARGTRGNSNSLEDYQYLEQLGIDPNVVNNDGVNALHYLSGRNKDLKLFDFFIDKNVDINQANKEGITPFMNAARSNDNTVIDYLLDKVKDINTIDENGYSALTHAVRYNRASVVDLLLKNKANALVVDKEGQSMVYHLIQSYNSSRHDDFIKKWKLLTDAGIELSAPISTETTIWHEAVKKDNLKLLNLISTVSKEKINDLDKDGMTALHLAAMQTKSPELLKFLIDQGASTQITTAFDETVYDLALENELLMNENANLDFLKP
ncbi:ankyrin repeat domain-containing protein [Nonlabens tegetincola]|uniref:ankyrin repeat domain-containing protein n=1 Tax=Nonlabens tegetincola TaxID=323273 RepID=UPI0030C8C65A